MPIKNSNLGTAGLFKNIQMQGARVSWSEAYFCVGRSNANGAQHSRWAFFNSPWLNYENYQCGICKSAVWPPQYQPATMPEIAFVGRKNLAKISKAPVFCEWFDLRDCKETESFYVEQTKY